ncbi:Maf family protein [Allosphingosinicella sp.]|uniref:Maf family protein n=1 Tax=Allosphingosinicella sp. TaxID=2823234 RepID=UPI0039C87DCA
MLEAAGVPFEVVDAPYYEEQAKLRFGELSPPELALALAEGKALSASGDGLVLGSDQTLERDDGTMLSKPASRGDAFRQLKSLSGRAHQLHSAAVIAESGGAIWRHVESVSLTMRPLSDDFLGSYLDAEYEAIRWSVGGYRIEGPGVQLFDRIEGSHFAILGLPLLPLLGYLRARGVLPS